MAARGYSFGAGCGTTFTACSSFVFGATYHQFGDGGTYTARCYTSYKPLCAVTLLLHAVAHLVQASARGAQLRLTFVFGATYHQLGDGGADTARCYTPYKPLCAVRLLLLAVTLFGAGCGMTFTACSSFVFDDAIGKSPLR